jgi:lipopolysaccharide transport system ATP-binding protein
MSENALVRFDRVGKKFCRDLKKSLWYGLLDSASDVFLSGSKSPSYTEAVPLRFGEFWANEDISFELKRGECLGLVGRNGAGKTTLLKLLNGLIKPDKGFIEIRGRIGALIALGAGFNPILTGRENIFVNGSVLGLSLTEIKNRVDEIVDFADLEDFIDSPVCNYSSGMQVRLGFAIATMLEPDVLVLDEVLAVGDASFRHKCYHRVNKLMAKSAVILVSHNMDFIGQMATAVGLMESGKLTLYKQTYEGITAYSEMNKHCFDANSDGGKVTVFYPPFCSVDVKVPETTQYGEALIVEINLSLISEISDAILSFVAINLNEQPVMAWQTADCEKILTLPSGHQTLNFKISPLLLHPGEYHWNLSISRRGSIEHLVWFMRAGRFSVVRQGRPIGNIPYLPLTNEIELIHH